VHLVTVGNHMLMRSATDEDRPHPSGVIWPRAGYWASART